MRRATSPAHGRTANVFGSGLAIMSLSSMRANPWIDEPSKPIPSERARGSSCAGISTLFRFPRRSVNQSWINRIPRDSTSFNTVSNRAVSSIMSSF